jgi:hydrogenase expression/formation protein HypC
MCLAVPSLIISKDGQMATVDVFGARKDISLALVSDDIKVGDYVLVHAGFAIQKMDRDESLDTLQLLRELTEIMEDSDKGAACNKGQGASSTT